MCIQCDHDYFSHGQQCERCRTSDVVSSAVVVAAIIALAGLGAAFIWHRRNAEGHPTKPSSWTALVQQAKAQVPILLQLCGLAIAINLMEHAMKGMEWMNMIGSVALVYVLCSHWNWVVLFQWPLHTFTVFCRASCSAHCCLQKGQLWTILAILASTLGPEDPNASKVSEYWELPYLQTLQLSISSLKDTVNLQCKFEARTDEDQDQVLFLCLFCRCFQGCGSVMITFVSRWYMYIYIYVVDCMRLFLLDTRLNRLSIKYVEKLWVLVFGMSWPQDGGWIRFTSAIASPVLPLIVLLLCLVRELVKPGSGIAAGLQVPCCIGKFEEFSWEFGWEEFVTLSRCSSEIKTEGWTVSCQT